MAAKSEGAVMTGRSRGLPVPWWVNVGIVAGALTVVLSVLAMFRPAGPHTTIWPLLVIGVCGFGAAVRERWARRRATSEVSAPHDRGQAER